MKYKIIKKKFNTFNDLYFHKYINTKMKNIKLNMSLAILGEKGIGKLTRIYMILENNIDDDDVYKVKKNTILLTKGTIKFEFEYYLSNHHVDLDLSLYKYQREIIKDFLEIYIQSINIASNQKKIVIIRNIHKLNKDILKYISLLIDKYHETSIFILTGKKINYYNLLSKVFIIKLKYIKDEEIKSYILEKYKDITDYQINNVLKKSKIFNYNNNIDNITNLLEMNYITGKYLDFTNSIQKIVDDIFGIIHSERFKFTDMEKIKEALYKMFSYNFPISDIMNYSVNIILNKFSHDTKYNDFLHKIIKIASKLQHKMIISNKNVMYLEKFYVEYTCLYQDMMKK